MSVETSVFVVQRGASQFKCVGSDIEAKLQSGDLLAVQHENDGVASKKTWADNPEEILDTDWLTCTDTNGVTYKVRGSLFKTLFSSAPGGYPWENHDGGIWHVWGIGGTNSWNDTGGVKLGQTPQQVWKLHRLGPPDPFTGIRPTTYGSGEIVDIEEIGPTTTLEGPHDYVFISGENCHALFNHFDNRNSDWRFLEFTNTSNVTNMSNMMLSSWYFTDAAIIRDGTNAPAPRAMAYWDVSKVTNFRYAFRDVGKEVWNSARQSLQFNNWDVANCSEFTFMFFGADVDFDASGWCTPQIDPQDFGGVGPLHAQSVFDQTPMANKTQQHPIWGTCP